MTAQPTYRVGTIGCGRKGTVHSRSYDLDPRATIVAGADTDQENLDLFCERFNVPGYSSYEEMIEKVCRRLWKGSFSKRDNHGLFSSCFFSWIIKKN